MFFTLFRWVIWLSYGIFKYLFPVKLLPTWNKYFRWDIVWADPYPKSKKKLTGINHKCYLNVIFVDFETDFCSIVLTKNTLTNQYLLVDKNLFKV